MKIGFYIKWDKHSLDSSGNVIGDELVGESLCRALVKLPEVASAELYAPNYLPRDLLDVMIYLNDTEPNEKWAKKHVLYFQNGYRDEGAEVVERLRKISYDGYIFFSKRLLTMHQSAGYDGLFLPFGVDTTLFYPRKYDELYAFDIAYVGNDIKGQDRTMCYLYPAAQYNFGLFGNWKIPKAKFRFWRNWRKQPPYKKLFEYICRGKIPQEMVPVLYSSAQINLNCTLQSCVDWDVITLRTYEIMACNGFLVSDKVPSAQQTLQDYVVFTEGGADLTEKIDYYLSNEKERKAIAGRGYEYVMKHASIEARAKEVFEFLGGIR